MTIKSLPFVVSWCIETKPGISFVFFNASSIVFFLGASGDLFAACAASAGFFGAGSCPAINTVRIERVVINLFILFPSLLWNI